MRRHQGAKVEHFDVSNVIYHKFSHGAVSYMLNGENVYVMLELVIVIMKIKKNKMGNTVRTELKSLTYSRRIPMYTTHYNNRYGIPYSFGNKMGFSPF